MTFAVEQSGKQAVIGCFLSEHDPPKKSFRTPSWIPEKPLNSDTTVQGFFEASSERFPKSSHACDPALKLADSSSIPHWMSSEQGQSTQSKDPAQCEMTPDVAPCTPMPSFSRQKAGRHQSNGATCAFPSLCLGLGSSARQQDQNSQIHSVTDLPYPSQLFFHQLPAKSPQSLSSTPSKSFNVSKSDVLMEGTELYKEDFLSLLLCKQEKQPQEGHGPHPVLPLGVYDGEPLHQRTPVSSRAYKFSFLEALTSEEAHNVQLTQHGDSLYRRMRLDPDSRLLIRGACKAKTANKDGCVPMFSGCSNAFDSGLGVSKELSDQSKPLIHCSSSLSKGAIKCVSPQRTNTGFFNTTTNAPFFSEVSPSRSAHSSCLPHDWNGTSMQCVKRTQLLPDFFAQQKVTTAAIADGGGHVGHDRGNPEKRCKLLFSQKISASGASQEYCVFNVPSIDGLPHSDEVRPKHQTSEQQKALGGIVEEASGTKTQWCGQPLQNSLRHVDVSKVKLEIQSEDSGCRKSAWKECIERNGKSVSSNGKYSPEVAMLNSCPTAAHAARYPSNVAASDAAGVVGNLQSDGLTLLRTSVYAQIPKVLSTVSTGEPSLSFSLEQSQQLMDFEGETTPVKRGSPNDGDWGKFLALSATPVGQTAEIDANNMLPFQRRFKQLQEFLKQCDESDQKYCLQALRSLSAAARTDHAVELETRAVRLSLEEGKELKRMKLLNVLGKFSEGIHV